MEAEERAEALRLAELYVTQESRWTDYDVVRLARALITAEAERAELARELEELRGALRRISNETRTDWLAARIARAALSEPTEGE